MSNKRVVITGVGTVNPIANNAIEFWENLLKGKSGIDKISRFDVSNYTTQIAGIPTNFDPSSAFDKKELRRISRFIIYGVVAAMEAVKNANLDISKDPLNIGVEVGSGIGGIEILEEMTHVLRDKGPSKVSPFTVPMMIPDSAAGQISIKTGAKGPNSCTVTACASSTHSVGNAFRIIQRGEAKAMITGGAECATSPLGLASFCAARSLSTRNNEPQKASRPFDNERDGFVMGEGAGILILEELEYAKKRGATILAEVVGYGSTGDAYHITAPAPEGEGAQRAIKMVLNDAKINANQIDYINAHGTSTQLNDKNETAAIKAVLAEHAYKVAISSTKSMTGHLLGAAGALELIACAYAIQNSMIPPTINLENPDPNCDLNYTPNKAIERNVDIAISNSFGFGGHNAVVAIRKFLD